MSLLKAELNCQCLLFLSAPEEENPTGFPLMVSSSCQSLELTYLGIFKAVKYHLCCQHIADSFQNTG
jgi:hypothetical protein